MRRQGSALRVHTEARRPGLTEPLSSEWRRADTEHLGDVRPSPVSAQDRPERVLPTPPEAASGRSQPSVSPCHPTRPRADREKIHLGAQSRRTCLWGDPDRGRPQQVDSRGQPWSAGAKGDQGARPLPLWSRGSPRVASCSAASPRRPRSRGCLWYPRDGRRACAHARGSNLERCLQDLFLDEPSHGAEAGGAALSLCSSLPSSRPSPLCPDSPGRRRVS